MSVAGQERAAACRPSTATTEGAEGDDDGDGGSSDLPVYKRENNMHEAVVWNGL